MHVQLANKQIGAWADLHDRRIPYLPYNTHKVLSYIRYKSSIGPWHTAVPPPHFCLFVYAISHISLQCVYIGHTAQAPIARLRKHMTDALAMVDYSRFHHMLRCTVLVDWFIVPLEFQATETAACVRERHWWFAFRARALNDVPPAIPQKEDEKRNGSRNRKLVLGLRDLGVARRAQDWASVMAIKGWVLALGRETGIPIVQVPPIVVSNLTPDMKRMSTCAVRHLVRQTKQPHRERRAILSRVRLVRKVPYTAVKIFQKHSRARGVHDRRRVCA